MNEDLLATNGRIDRLDRKMTKQSEAVKQRFNGTDQRLDTMDQRFDVIDNRLDNLATEVRETNQLLRSRIADQLAHRSA